jgi:hypothetical protein
MADLSSKLQLKQGQAVVAFEQPADLDLALPVGNSPVTADDTVLAFARDSVALDGLKATLLDAAATDRLTWLAYPKAGKSGTDLNRDLIRERLLGWGLRPVRQVALDDLWSALRIRVC